MDGICRCKLIPNAKSYYESILVRFSYDTMIEEVGMDPNELNAERKTDSALMLIPYNLP